MSSFSALPHTACRTGGVIRINWGKEGSYFFVKGEGRENVVYAFSSLTPS